MESKKQKLSVKTLVYLAMLAAIQIVLTRFLSIQTPILRIGFGFIPYILTAMLFGPIIGGIYGVVTDFIGVLLFPTGGGYFPGFTLSAFLGAFIYGLFLYKKPKKLWRFALSIILVTLIVDICLNTYWLTILTGKSAYALLPVRITKDSIMATIKIILMPIIWKYVGIHIEKSFMKNSPTQTAKTI